MINFKRYSIKQLAQPLTFSLHMRFNSSASPKDTKEVPVGNIPKKSSSLILFRKNGQNKGPFDYDIFFFKRHSKGSFSDMYAFPGGQLENQDIEAEKNNECEKYRYCAVRETFEEIGLYFTAKEIGEQQVKEAADYFRQKGIQMDDYKTLTRLIQPDLSIDKFQAYIRLVTIPQIKQRYDCYFYIYELQHNRMINWYNYLHNSSNPIHDSDHIILNEKEGVQYEWMNPLQCLQKFYQKELLLAPPQFIILNTLSSFLKYEDLQHFLSNQTHNPRSDPMYIDPHSFPYLISMQSTTKIDPQLQKQYPFTATVAGDYKYPLDKICANEQDEQFKNELFEKTSQLQIDENSRSRIYFKNPQKLFENEFEVDFNSNKFSPLIHMKNYNEIQKLISTHISD